MRRFRSVAHVRHRCGPRYRIRRRDTSWNGNSDSMIVASINKKTRRIHLISLMRDLYADIESYGARKLNAACAIGGPTLLVSTIESNYRIKIDHYACVDFVSMARIIDLLGGVTIEVSEEEATTANGLIQDMCNTQGIDSAGHLYENGAGSYNADGLMAVGYSRIRFVGNSDYERTERQRFVLSQIMSRVKSMNAQELNAFIEEYVRSKGGSIDRKSSSMVAEHVGSDLKRLKSEIDKVFVTFAPDAPKNITASLVERCIGISKDFNSFELRDAIVAHNIEKANLIVKHLMGDPRSGGLFSMIPTLFSYFQNLMLAHYAPAPRDASAIMSYLGLRSEFATKAYTEGMKHYSPMKTIQIIDKFREIDAKSKGLDATGNTTPEELAKELIFFILH